MSKTTACPIAFQQPAPFDQPRGGSDVQFQHTMLPLLKGLCIEVLKCVRKRLTTPDLRLDEKQEINASLEAVRKVAAGQLVDPVDICVALGPILRKCGMYIKRTASSTGDDPHLPLVCRFADGYDESDMAIAMALEMKRRVGNKLRAPTTSAPERQTILVELTKFTRHLETKDGDGPFNLFTSMRPLLELCGHTIEDTPGSPMGSRFRLECSSAEELVWQKAKMTDKLLTGIKMAVFSQESVFSR